MKEILYTTTITCPSCKHQKEEQMPVYIFMNALVVVLFYSQNQVIVAFSAVMVPCHVRRFKKTIAAAEFYQSL